MEADADSEASKMTSMECQIDEISFVLIFLSCARSESTPLSLSFRESVYMVYIVVTFTILIVVLRHRNQHQQKQLQQLFLFCLSININIYSIYGFGFGLVRFEYTGSAERRTNEQPSNNASNNEQKYRYTEIKKEI